MASIVFGLYETMFAMLLLAFEIMVMSFRSMLEPSLRSVASEKECSFLSSN